jgi:putative transposase
MSGWVYAVLHLLFEGQAARRDARVRFLLAQIEILRSKLDGNRVIPAPADRARLLAIGKELDHDVNNIVAIVQPATYERWLREFRTGKKPRPVGRPKVSAVRRRLIVRFARENLGWGYRRIVGELHKLHLPVGRSTIRRILQEEGLTPPPKSGRRTLATETPWRKFLRLHMNTLVACDFFTKNVITPLGTRTAYGLFFIHLQTRQVFVCPATYHPNQQWVAQQARNAQMWMDEEGIEARFLLRDRDTKFAPAFDRAFIGSDIRIVKTPVQAPDANAFAESWIGSLKRECLDSFHLLQPQAPRPHPGRVRRFPQPASPASGAGQSDSTSCSRQRPCRQ